ncbi:MAG: hypothetical protein HPM95_06940 [Alphaproteobacteria bacterium]|nr:hypothetical protein [Alphaproteobacteria bacterium]
MRAAVGTLERILVMAPQSPAVLLELGVLYYRLGSFETARIYLPARGNHAGRLVR